jgi:hypothetical protein
MLQNNQNIAGQKAGKSLFSGNFRFAMFPVHTRFETCEWFITDAFQMVNGSPDVVFQGNAADALAQFDAISLLDVAA